MSTVSDRRPKDERGVTMILVALVLVGLMVMAAMVLDMGAVFSDRRQDQSAADAGALAAAFALPNRTLAVSQAKTYVHDTLGRTFTSTEWDSCGSAAVPSGYTKVTGSSCIAINGSARRALVRIPDQQRKAGFGQVIGITNLTHSAFAIAGLTPLGFGGVLPFGLVGQTAAFMCADSGGGNTGFCKSSGSGVSPGSFGVTDFAWWGDDIAGTTVACSTNGQASVDRIPNNVAVGVDHDLEINPNPSNPTVRKLDTGSTSPVFACPGQSASNSALTITGENLGDDVGPGLWSGSNFTDNGDARLQRLGTLPNTPSWMLQLGRTTRIGSFDLDNIPLWEFIPDSFSGASVPRSCWRDQFTGPDNVFGNSDDKISLPVAVRNAITPATGSMTNADRVVVLMDRCFKHYGEIGTGPQAWPGVPALGVNMSTSPDPPCLAYVSNGDGTVSSCTTPATSFTAPVFSRNTAVEAPLDLYDIQYTPRFAFVPKTTEPTGSSDPRDFTSFYTIYIQRVLVGCSAGSGCGLDFDPGVGYSKPSLPSNVHGGLDAMGVFVFPHSSILPNGLALADAAFRDNANRIRSLVR